MGVVVWHSEEMVEVSRRLQEVEDEVEVEGEETEDEVEVEGEEMEDEVEVVAEMKSKSEREGLLELLGTV